MTEKNKIVEDFAKLDILEILQKYRDVNDLYLIMNLAIEAKRYDDFSSILFHFPKTEEHDKLKRIIIQNYSDILSPFSIFEIIESIVNDNTKLKLLEKYTNKLEGFEIASIISSMNDDNLKKKKFREYIAYFNSEDFSDYIRKIKDDDIRDSEFSLFKKNYSDYRLDWIAASYSNDEKRMEVFKNNYDESKKKEIPFFIFLLQSDAAKLAILDFYKDSIKSEDMWHITTTLTKQDKIIDIINRYSDKVPVHEINDLLKIIEDVNTRYELLEKYIDFLDEDDILEIMTNLQRKYDDINDIISYLLLKTNNEETIKKIYEVEASLGYHSDNNSKAKRK